MRIKWESQKESRNQLQLPLDSESHRRKSLVVDPLPAPHRKGKAVIAKKALECGIMRTISHYAKIDPEQTLSPSTGCAHLEGQVHSGVYGKVRRLTCC